MRWGQLFVILFIATAGCGDTESPSAPASRARSQERTSHAKPLTDSVLVKASLLRRSDLPLEWSKVPPISTRQHCAAEPFRTAIASGTSHYNSGQNDVQQRAVLFRSERQAAVVYAGLGAARAVACFHRVIREALRAHSGGRLLSPITDIRFDDLGTTARAIRMNARLESVAGPVSVYIDNVQKRAGRGLSTLAIIGAMAPIDAGLYERIVRTMGRRVVDMGNFPTHG